MKTIFADFNGMTEGGYVSLETVGSKADIAGAGLQPGDWAWLSDGELLVGAQLAVDDRYGRIGIVDWDTLVHLDDEDASDIAHVRVELHGLLTKVPHSDQDEPRIFQLLTVLELTAPQTTHELPVTLSFRRAVALRQMGRLRLALIEAAQARRERPGDPKVEFLYLELLRLENLPSAVTQAQAIAKSSTVPALVLSGCINILATQAEQASDDQFESWAKQVIDLCDRMDHSPDLERVGYALVALASFNRGLILLRAGKLTQARDAFDRACEIYPDWSIHAEVRGLQTYDRHARDVARCARAIVEQWVPDIAIAA
jgi:hypothetical protein